MEKIRKKQQISALEVGDQIDDVFVVKIKKGMSEYANGFRFNLLISDNSGKTLEYVYWGPRDEKSVKEIYDSIKSDSVVKIQAKVSSYKEKLQLATNAPFKIEVLSEEQYEKEDFVKPSKKDLPKLYDELKSSISLVGDEKIRIPLSTSL